MQYLQTLAARMALCLIAGTLLNADWSPARGEEPAENLADHYQWINVTPQAPFMPRDGAGALSYRGKMWLIGGWNPGQLKLKCSNDVWSSPNGRDWTEVKPNTFLNSDFNATEDWEGRHTAGYAVFKDKMWIVGGDPLQGHYQSDIWNSENGKDWTLVLQEAPWGPRALHYTVVHEGKLWVIGGQTMPAFAPAEEKFYRDVWNSEDGVHWTKLEPREPCWSPRGMIGGAAVLRGRIWILGGGTYDTPMTKHRNFYNDVWSSADEITWTRHAESTTWKPREYHEVAAFDGRLWVLEGWNQGNRNDVWASADGTNWQELPGTPWKPRHAASVFVFQDALWMVAGNNFESDVWKLVRKSEK